MKRNLLLTLLLAAVSPWGRSANLVFPWVTNNENFHTTIVINNLGPDEAQLQLTATRAAGVTTTPSQTVNRSLNPFGQLVIDAADLFPEMGPGSGYVVRLGSASTTLSGNLLLAASSTDSGNSPSQVKAVSADDAAPILLFSYLPIAEGGFSAPVIVNMGEVETTVTFFAYQDGQLLGQCDRPLLAGHPFAEQTRHLFPDLSGDLYVVASSVRPLLGLAFLFNGLGEPSMAEAEAIDQVPDAPSGLPDASVRVRALTVTTLVDSTYPADYSDSLLNDAISVDPNGNIYVNDFTGRTPPLGAPGTVFGEVLWHITIHPIRNGTQISVITPQGAVSAFSRSSFGGPLGSAFDEQGFLYFCSYQWGEVYKAAPDGSYEVIGSGFDRPGGTVFDSKGNLYVVQFNPRPSNRLSRNIYKMTPDGNFSTFLTTTLFNGALGVTRDEDDNLYVANFFKGHIYKVTPDAQITLLARIQGPSNFRCGYITYGSGHIFAAGFGNNRIYKINLNGEIGVLAGSGEPGKLDGPADQAQFHGPNGIALAPGGDILYVTDAHSKTLRKITLEITPR